MAGELSAIGFQVEYAPATLGASMSALNVQIEYLPEVIRDPLPPIQGERLGRFWRGQGNRFRRRAGQE